MRIGSIRRYLETTNKHVPARQGFDNYSSRLPARRKHRPGFQATSVGKMFALNDARWATRNADPPRYCRSDLAFSVALIFPLR